MVHTSHYTFHAIGSTPEHAIETLLAAWQAHARQTSADPDYVTRDDINVVTGKPGNAFRDWSPIATDDFPAGETVEAVCNRCGQTFLPSGPDDLIHLANETGEECGGTGEIVGSWK
jgi:hypothetical protein